MGRALLLENHYTDEDEALSKIDGLTAADIIRVARLLVDPARMALAVAGKPREEKSYRRLLSSFAE